MPVPRLRVRGKAQQQNSFEIHIGNASSKCRSIKFATIFTEMESVLGPSKNLSIQLSNGVLCSMGYNKNSTKIKIESNFFSGLCYMFVVFVTRFNRYN